MSTVSFDLNCLFFCDSLTRCILFQITETCNGDATLPHIHDFGLKLKIPLSLNREQVALTTAIDNDVTRNNSILYSCINSDTLQVDHQFTK